MIDTGKRSPGRATIIGGSIAGLAAGLALLRDGWEIQIFETTHGNLENRGAGIITHQALFDAFNTLGFVGSKRIDPAQLGIPIRNRRTFAKDGSLSGELELPQIATSWGRLFARLKKAYPSCRYHPLKTFTHCVQHHDRVEAHFTDGAVETSDLLVAADGIRSTVRKQLEANANPEYVGYMAWRGLINEQDLSETEKNELLPYFTFCLPEGEQVLTYPIAGAGQEADAGDRLCNVVWYRPAAKQTTLAELLTDVDGNNNGESIAPDKVRTSIVKRLHTEAVQLLSPQHAQLICKLHQPFIQPIYDLTTQSMAHGRVAIIGDAAFTARPHLGVGITKAVEDAIALADALGSHTEITQALSQFNNQRHQTNQAWVDRSRELGAYLQAQLMNENQKRFAELHRTASAVMRETAVLSY